MNRLYTKECNLGQLTTTNEVKTGRNPEGITGPEMMVQLQAQAERFGQMFVMAGLLK
jgi:thioredoxin reductase